MLLKNIVIRLNAILLIENEKRAPVAARHSESDNNDDGDDDDKHL